MLTRRRIQFVARIRKVHCDRRNGNVQSRGNTFAAQPVGQRSETLKLARRKLLLCGFGILHAKIDSKKEKRRLAR